MIIFMGLAVISVLVIQLYRFQKGMDAISRQLEQVDDGSQIEITTDVRSKSFLRLCNRLNSVLEKARTEENQRLRSQRKLKETVSAIAHDIRTPLTSASGYLQMMAECEDEVKRVRYHFIIRQRMDELKNMLEELFLYTKLTSEGFELECSSISVYPVLSECLIEIYDSFQAKGIEPEVEFEDETLQVMASHEGLSRIFRNLIHNALMHGASGLKILQSGNTLIFSNEIPEGIELDAGRIFDRFYKADRTRRKGSSGFGLAIVKELVMRMGGRISAQVKDQVLSITINFISM